MTRYVLLLRGVNVGGNRRVPNSELRMVLELLGCTNVITYINSGNAIFDHKAFLTSETFQVALQNHFGFPVPALVLPGKKVEAIAGAIPSSWTNDMPRPDKSGHKSDVLYLFDAINSPDILEKLGYNPMLETMVYVDGALLATISRANQSKGSLQKLVGTQLYSQMTVRNIATAKKLAELAR